jgi:hypothetical protein
VNAETPAATLKAAADKLRTLLAHPELTPGPWLSMDHGDRLLWDGPGAEDLPPRYVVDEPMSNGANASFIATLHPGVGVALADWLEHVAEEQAAIERGMWSDRPACGWCDGDHALAVARAVLGKGAQR